MKKIRYNSLLARLFLFGGYSTITLAAWVCTKYKNKEEMPQWMRNHECTHARQWVECMLASGVIIWALVLFAGISAWYFALAFSIILQFICFGMDYQTTILQKQSLSKH